MLLVFTPRRPSFDLFFIFWIFENNSFFEHGWTVWINAKMFEHFDFSNNIQNNERVRFWIYSKMFAHVAFLNTIHKIVIFLNTVQTCLNVWIFWISFKNLWTFELFWILFKTIWTFGAFWTSLKIFELFERFEYCSKVSELFEYSLSMFDCVCFLNTFKHVWMFELLEWYWNINEYAEKIIPESRLAPNHGMLFQKLTRFNSAHTKLLLD